MGPLKVAAVQAAPVLANRDATIGMVIALAETAAAQGARLVAFPEAFVPGYPDRMWRTEPWDATATALYARLLDQAVVAGSPATDLLAVTARRLGIWLCTGADERDENGSTARSARRVLRAGPQRRRPADHLLRDRRACQYRLVRPGPPARTPERPRL
jgi:predicted amidohydrolase